MTKTVSLSVTRNFDNLWHFHNLDGIDDDERGGNFIDFDDFTILWGINGSNHFEDFFHFYDR